MAERTTATIMTDGTRDMVRLATCLSPAFPVGAFSYSHGLECMVSSGRINCSRELADWLDDLLCLGSAWSDAVLFAEAWNATSDGDDPRLAAAAELGEALAPSAERLAETMEQGTAFLRGAGAWAAVHVPGLPHRAPYPVAVAAVCAAHGIGCELALAAYLHAFVANQVSAAIRLVPLGQSDGLAVLARLEPLVLDTAARAAQSSLDDLGSATMTADIAAMTHETQHSRLFRS
ncbi:MAG TPA: urease accessory protein UreF [Aestuariivirgaceae bacterium]|nr:urease accessory protein UreF [Aestuariivirgaceae bacterium]